MHVYVYEGGRVLGFVTKGIKSLFHLCTCAYTRGVAGMQSCLRKGFHYSKEYASKFEPLMEFFAENETLDLDAMASKDHGRLAPICPLLLPSPAHSSDCLSRDAICRRDFLSTQSLSVPEAARPGHELPHRERPRPSAGGHQGPEGYSHSFPSSLSRREYFVTYMRDGG